MSASLPPSHPVHHLVSSSTITHGRCACGEEVPYDGMAEHIARAEAMSADEYTPSTASVRARWSVGCLDGIPAGLAEFDRWLAQHDREVKAAAWDEGYSHLFDAGRASDLTVVSLDDNPYRIERGEEP